MVGSEHKDGSKDLVAARLKFAERMRLRGLGRSGVGGKKLGTGPPNRHGAPRLPTGQHESRTWPVLDLGHRPDVRLENWTLEVVGLVAKPVVLDWAGLMALPQTEQSSDFHCVTTWSVMDSLWMGVTFRALAELVVPLDAARFVLCTGSDFAPGTSTPYTTNFPIERALDSDVMLVHRWQGEPLTAAHGGPCRMITPRMYAWKGTKWIRRIEFLAEDQPGFWEQRGYSDTADPWADDRFQGSNQVSGDG